MTADTIATTLGATSVVAGQDTLVATSVVAGQDTLGGTSAVAGQDTLVATSVVAGQDTLVATSVVAGQDTLVATSVVPAVDTLSVTPAVVTLAAAGAEFNIGSLSATPFVASNSVSSSDTSDTFSFSLSSTKDINLALTGMSADADVLLYRDSGTIGVIDASDTLIGSSAYGSNHDEAINVGSQPAGNYLVQVSRFLNADTKYDLRLSATDNYTPSNLLPTEVEVGTLSGTQTFKGCVGDNNTADVYHFIAPQAGTFHLSMTGLSSDADVRVIHDTNTNLAVDTSSGANPTTNDVIGISQAGGTSNESITASLTAGDNYFVEVYQYSGNTAYNLSMSFA